ncbi:30S ribosomal protein S8 [Candidatus Omnitrophota bacterium]
MSLTDPIANMLTMTRNAVRAKKETVEIPVSKTIRTIAEILKKEGYIENLRLIEEKKQGKIKIYLKFDAQHKPAITGIKKVSKSGLRVYVNAEKIPYVLNGLGIAILSTNKGILTDKQARDARVGGEVLCYVW